MMTCSKKSHGCSPYPRHGVHKTGGGKLWKKTSEEVRGIRIGELEWRRLVKIGRISKNGCRRIKTTRTSEDGHK